MDLYSAYNLRNL